MPVVKDPVTGLEFYELSHRWGMYTPIFPGYEEIKLERITHHAKQGVMTHKITTIFHTSTHVNAPIHLIPGAAAVGDLALRSLLRHRRRAVDPEEEMGADRAGATWKRPSPTIHAGDIVLINTGWHRRYSDSKEYFGHAPGLSKSGRRVAGEEEGQAGRRRHRLRRSSARDLARPAPQRAADQVPAAGIQAGDRPRRDRRFPGVERRRTRCCSRPAFRPSRTSAAISTTLAGKRCTFQGFPWKWHEGDACVDPPGGDARSRRAAYRLEPGNGRRAARAEAAERRAEQHRRSAVLSISPTAGATACRNGRRAPTSTCACVEFHAKDGLLVQQFEGIMHRGTHMDAPIHVQENRRR